MSEVEIREEKYQIGISMDSCVYIPIKQQQQYYNLTSTDTILQQIPSTSVTKRIIVCSDTHQMHDKVKVPDGDIFIHCGDFTNLGTVFEAISFNTWLGTLPHKYKVVIPGNHENFPDVIKPFLTNATHFLLDTHVLVENIKIYGSRFKPWYAFNFYMNDGQQKADWDPIPDDVDILITHQPPKGILGECDDKDRGNHGLLKLVEKHKPKVHVFGHIHEYHGCLYDNDATTFVNAAMCLSKKKKMIRKKPIAFDIIVHNKKSRNDEF